MAFLFKNYPKVPLDGVDASHILNENGEISKNDFVQFALDYKLLDANETNARRKKKKKEKEEEHRKERLRRQASYLASYLG